MELFKRASGDEGGIGGGKLGKISKYKLKRILRNQENVRKELESIEFKNPHIVNFDIGSKKTGCACFDVTQDLGKINMADVYKNVIGLTTFSNYDLGRYIEKIKKKFNVQGWLLSVPLLLDKRNRECSMDFRDTKAFLQLLKEVRLMENNHFAFTNEHLSSDRGRDLDPMDPVIPNERVADFQKTGSVDMKAAIIQMGGYLEDITGKIIFILYLCIH